MIEEGGQDGHDVVDREIAVEAGVGEHNADVLAVSCGERIEWFSEHAAGAAIWTGETQEELEGGALAGAVAPDESGHITRTDTERAVEMKSGVGFLQVVKCDHSDPSKIMSNKARISSSEMPSRRPLRMACSSAASTSFFCSSRSSSLLVAAT